MLKFLHKIYPQVVITDHQKEKPLISKVFEQLSQQNFQGKCGGAHAR